MEWTVGKDEAGARLDKFLAAADRLGSRGRATAALERGKVMVNGADAGIRESGRRLHAGDIVRVWIDRPGSARRPLGTIDRSDLRIVHEDADLLVLDKPAGLLAVPLDRRGAAASVYERLQERLRSHITRQPFVVHRIDRDTSGLVIFALNPSAQASLREQFKRREPSRVYRAVVYGQPDPPAGTWRDYLVWDDAATIQTAAAPGEAHAKEAISDYCVLDTFRDASFLEVRLQTGRRNQIRIQAGLRGYTVVGEKRYLFGPGPSRPIAFPRQALHAYRLTCRHPHTGRVLEFEAAIPADMLDLLKRLRRDAETETAGVATRRPLR